MRLGEADALRRHVVDQGAHFGHLVARGVHAHHDRTDGIHHAVEDELSPDRAARIGDDARRETRFGHQLAEPRDRFSFSARGPEPGVLAVHEVMDAPRTVVARRLERYAVRDVEIREPHEYLLVAHAVLEGYEHWPPLENRANRFERCPGRLRFDQDDHGIETTLAHFRRAREGREPRHRFGAARELQAVLPDRLDVRAVRIEHGDVGDPGEGGRVEAAYRASAYDENVSALGHRSGRMISGCRAQGDRL